MNIKSLFIAAWAVAISTMFASCGDAKSAELVKTLKTSYDYDGKQVELIGHLNMKNDVRITAENKVQASLVVGSGDNIEVAGFETNFGKTKNSIFINAKPDGTFTEFDVTVYDKDAVALPIKLNAVKIKATVEYYYKDKKDKIAQANKYAYLLKDITIEKK